MNTTFRTHAAAAAMLLLPLGAPLSWPCLPRRNIAVAAQPALQALHVQSSAGLAPGAAAAAAAGRHAGQHAMAQATLGRQRQCASRCASTRRAITPARTRCGAATASTRCRRSTARANFGDRRLARELPLSRRDRGRSRGRRATNRARRR
jgi:hypothetical protein